MGLNQSPSYTIFSESKE